MERAQDNVDVVMWRPDSKKKCRTIEFMEKVNGDHDLKLETYADLWQWSIDHYPDFWEAVWKFLDIIHSEPYEQVIDPSKNISEIPEWFAGSKLNYAENMLRYNDNRVAIYAAAEGKKEVDKLTFHELRETVATYAASLKTMGVKKGDRVVGYIPNCIVAVAATLAAASLGAIWSSTSPDFGVTGVLDRFSQIKPKVIFSVDAVVYNGKAHNHLEKLKQVVDGLPDIEKVVIIPYVNKQNTIDISNIQKSCFLGDFLESGRTEDGEIPPLEFAQLPFNHPLYIMYSSGTTGPPKCMVHSAGGTLLKHLAEHVLQSDMTRDDVLLYYSTTGWMMWNWMITAIAAGSAIVLYDGSPLVPSPSVLWDLVDEIGITVLGTGAKWLAVLEDKGVHPAETHSLKTLKCILSTGSPLKPASFDYVYKHIKEDLLLGSITGGTDIIGCFAGQSWMVPVYRGELQTRLLGMAMESADEEGKIIHDESGELVCTKPFPSMPTHFWNDQDGIKYKKAYFSKYEGLWAHGDFCVINSRTGGVVMLGRSDGTLNPNGVRFGSAELYNIVESFKEIQDSLAVPQRNKDGDERVILFLKMENGFEFNEDVVKKVKNSIRSQLSARHVPGIILKTQDIPYTISGKKVEVAVRRIISGEDIKVRGAFTNPNSLDLYYNLPELQGY
ncbi:acetoacetyl-CoA synthetase-like [Ptychodera flava]|uniref:acetoacetyl-CoA synthetase-like n=1 Tax=Ptychodera flava TaxID=63121 RepID=UPI00396AA2A7